MEYIKFTYAEEDYFVFHPEITYVEPNVTITGWTTVKLDFVKTSINNAEVTVEVTDEIEYYLPKLGRDLSEERRAEFFEEKEHLKECRPLYKIIIKSKNLKNLVALLIGAKTTKDIKLSVEVVKYGESPTTTVPGQVLNSSLRLNNQYL